MKSSSESASLGPSQHTLIVDINVMFADPSAVDDGDFFPRHLLYDSTKSLDDSLFFVLNNSISLGYRF